MKRILWFVGLKIVEIIGVVITWRVSCFVGRWVFVMSGDEVPDMVLSVGLVGVVTLVVLVFIVILLVCVIKANWQWSKKLLDNWNKK